MFIIIVIIIIIIITCIINISIIMVITIIIIYTYMCIYIYIYISITNNIMCLFAPGAIGRLRAGPGRAISFRMYSRSMISIHNLVKYQRSIISGQ